MRYVVLQTARLRGAGRRRTLASLPAVLLIPIAISLLWQLHALDASTKWEQREDAVIAQRRELHDALVQETDAVSGYLLTGDRSARMEISRSRKHSEALLAGLHHSIGSTSSDRARALSRAERIYARWLQDTNTLTVGINPPPSGVRGRLWHRASAHMHAMVVALRPLADVEDARREESIEEANFLARWCLGFLLAAMTLSLAVLWLDARRSRQLAAAQAREDEIQAQLAREREQTLQLEYDTKRAQEAGRLKSEFIANMSHELRTPLTAIVGFSDLLLDGMAGPLAEPQRRHVMNISHSGLHLLHLINDVLDSALIESGKLRLRRERTGLAARAREAVDVIEPLALKNEVRIALHTIDAPPFVNVDPARFQQVLYNLLSNSVKFTRPGGSIGVIVRRAGADGFSVIVSDSGIGIEPADLARLFEPFAQLDSSVTKQYRGTGLGLALTRRLVEAHGGSVEVQSRFGAGSQFTVYFPDCVDSAGSERSIAS
jgi:signal transduction histidine kinase